MLVRKLFPTVGRSDGVMTGIRDRIQNAYGQRTEQTSEDPKFGPTNKSEIKEKLTDWSPARLQRRLVLMRSKCQGKHSYNGLKRLALTRLLERASHSGDVTVLVVPVSPIYQKEFLTPSVVAEFEQAIESTEDCCAKAKFIRLDRVPSLQDGQLFADLVHLNTSGQRIATAAFLEEFEKRVSRQ